MRSGTLVLTLIVTTSLFAAPRRRAVTPDRCTEVVSPATLSFPSSGGSAPVNVTVNGGCTWSPVASDPWVTATQTSTGINVTVAPNTSTTSRTSLIHVRSAVIAVKQDATTNLVQNATFDNDVSGWTTEFAVGFGTATWSGGGGIIVAPPSTPQGAAQITWQAAGPGGSGYQLDQCVAITGNTRYIAGTKAFIPPGQSAGLVTFGVCEYLNPGCAQHGAVGCRFFMHKEMKVPVGEWFDFAPFTWTSNATAQSALIVIGAGGDAATTPPFTAYFDDIYLRPNP